MIVLILLSAVAAAVASCSQRPATPTAVDVPKYIPPFYPNAQRAEARRVEQHAAAERAKEYEAAAGRARGDVAYLEARAQAERAAERAERIGAEADESGRKAWRIFVPTMLPDFASRSEPYAHAVWAAMAQVAGGEDALRDAGFRKHEVSPIDGESDPAKEEEAAAIVIDAARIVSLVELETRVTYVRAAFREPETAARVAAHVRTLNPNDGQQFDVSVKTMLAAQLRWNTYEAYREGDAANEAAIPAGVDRVLRMEGRAGPAASSEEEEDDDDDDEM